MSTSPVATAIIAGELDDVLTQIYDAVKWRRAELAAVEVRKLRPGARIRISASDSVLGGREGEVEKVNPKTIAVKLDPVPHDSRNDWKVPHTFVEAI